MAGTVVVRVVADAEGAGKAFDKLAATAAKTAGALGDVGGGLQAFAQHQKDAAGAADAQKQAQLNVTKAQQAYNDALKEYGANSTEAQQAQLDLNAAQRDAQPPSGFEEFGNTLAGLQPTIMLVAGAFDLMTIATELATTANIAFAASLLANPITWIVIGVIALVAAIILLWKNWDKVSKFLIASWDAIKKAAVAVFNFLKGYFTIVFNFLKNLFTTAIQRLVSAWDFLKTIPSKLFNIFITVFNFLNSIPRRLYNIGKDIINGLIDGLQSGFNWIKNKLGSLGRLIPDWLKDVLGIASPSKVMKTIGQQTMQGYIDGITSSTRGIEGAMNRVSGITPNPDFGAAGAGGRGGFGGTYVAPGAIVINVPPTADKAAIGREVLTVIQAWERQSGVTRLVYS
jgi:phage-related protein